MDEKTSRWSVVLCSFSCQSPGTLSIRSTSVSRDVFELDFHTYIHFCFTMFPFMGQFSRDSGSSM